MTFFNILVVASFTVSLYAVWAIIRLTQEVERQRQVCIVLLEWASEQIYDKYYGEEGAEEEDG